MREEIQDGALPHRTHPMTTFLRKGNLREPSNKEVRIVLEPVSTQNNLSTHCRQKGNTFLKLTD